MIIKGYHLKFSGFNYIPFLSPLDCVGFFVGAITLVFTFYFWYIKFYLFSLANGSNKFPFILFLGEYAMIFSILYLPLWSYILIYLGDSIYFFLLTKE